MSQNGPFGSLNLNLPENQSFLEQPSVIMAQTSHADSSFIDVCALLGLALVAKKLHQVWTVSRV